MKLEGGPKLTNVQWTKEFYVGHIAGVNYKHRLIFSVGLSAAWCLDIVLQKNRQRRSWIHWCGL